MTVQDISQVILKEKYAKGSEASLADVRRRVADAAAGVEEDPGFWAQRFFECMERGFIPGGRINSAAGTGIGATLINCFVQPVGDAMSGTDDTTGKPGITVALQEAAETMRRGGGVGYDFSQIRPLGALVKGTDSMASGPLSYMRMFDAMCQTVESAGSRRGAQMGVLRVDHPDIEAFVAAKARPYAEKELQQFNISVGVTDAFMRAVSGDSSFPLAHRAEPGEAIKAAGTYQRDDGLWVYRSIQARDLWEKIMRSTYDFADPGVLFLDRINAANNLQYTEVIEATNPCGEQNLPDYGCCDLGSMNLTQFVVEPFRPNARFDMESLAAEAGVAIRLLDNVLDVTLWPLDKQRDEAHAKRRVGLGFTGLGDTLLMLNLKYDTLEARQFAAEVAERMRDAVYDASVLLAESKGAFRLFDKEKYLKQPFIRRLPERIRDGIAEHGIRNSHLLSIAPTGTISLAFGNNCSSGIEPVFDHHYQRMVRQPDGSRKAYRVYDHAYLQYKALKGQADGDDAAFIETLSSHWVTAHQISAEDHLAMVAAVAPFVDAAISKTINVAEDYTYEDFKDIYLKAWKGNLKGVTTYRPNSQVDAVLLTDAAAEGGDFDESDPDRRIRISDVPEPALHSLRWVKRPRFPSGNAAWTYMVEHPGGSFAVMVGHAENGRKRAFEVWVNGAEVPRGLGALAKSLSMNMRTRDQGFLETVLDSLGRSNGDDGFDMALPPVGDKITVPSMVSGFARVVKYRCDALGMFEGDTDTDVEVALLSKKEPKTGPGGTMSWTVDIYNPATGDDFVMGLKELVLPNGQRRPYSVWLSGEYPRVFDGLCKVLSFDMRVVDPAWVGAKLRQLGDFPEARGDFFAKVPGKERSESYPSTVAYMARLIIHRYAQLGILDEEGFPMEHMGVMVVDRPEDDGVVLLSDYQEKARAAGAMEVTPGRRCGECGNYAVIRVDGCERCTACGEIGSCG